MRILFGLAALVIIACFIISSVDLREVATSISNANYTLLAVAIAIKVFTIYIKANRWGVSLTSADVPRPKKLFAATIIGTASNLVLPARMGEVARTLVLKQHTSLSMVSLLTSTVAMGIVDFIFLATTLFIVIISGSVYANLFSTENVMILFVVLLLLVGGIFLLVSNNIPFSKQLRTAGRFFLTQQIHTKLRGFLHSAQVGLQIFKNRKKLEIVSLLTVCVWCSEIFAVFLGLQAFGISASLWMASILCLSLNLAFVLPVTPGNVGVHQLLSILILERFQIGETAALSFSLGFQGATLISILLLGLVFFLKEGAQKDGDNR